MSGLRITPQIDERNLPRDTLFVFGSNESGVHGSGAAKLAREAYGAKLGQGFGLCGQTFAIPTKDWSIDTLPLNIIRFYVERFIVFANNPYFNWNYYVTKIGCGLAGYDAKDIAPMFSSVRNNIRVWLPEDFIEIIDNQGEKSNNLLIDENHEPVRINLRNQET